MAQDRLRITGHDYLQYVPAPTREFHPDHGYLPDSERLALDHISDAVRGVARAYVYQTDPQTLRPFYAHNVSSARITREAKEKPELLSPYTLVELGPGGELVAVPAHVAFADQLKEPIKKIREAKYFTQDPALSRVLQATVDALEKGDYEGLERTILQEPPTKIGVRISLYNRYKDEILGIKFAFHAAVGTLDEEATAKHQPIVDSIVDAYLSSDLNTPKTIIRPKVRIRYNRTENTGGLPAAMELTADSSPCQLEWREKFGTEINMEEPPFYHKFHRYREPLQKDIIVYEKRQPYEELSDNYAYRYDIHETMHALVRRTSDEKRFGRKFTFMNEMSSTILGLSLAPRAGFTPRQLEGVFVDQLLIAADEYRICKEEHNTARLETYLRGDAVLINALMQDGVLQINERGEFKWKNIYQVYEKIGALAQALEVLLVSGDMADAEGLKDKLGNLSFFEDLRRFRRNASPLPPITPTDNFRMGLNQPAPRETLV